MKHEIIIKRDFSKEEEFEKKGDNLGTIWILGPDGYRINNDLRVQIFLSKNGLIGLGSEMIRLAYDFREGRHWHLEPISKDNKVQTMGVYLAPDSNELIVCCGDLGKVEDCLK